MKKLFGLLVLLIVVTSCTVTARPVEREHRHKKHMCTEKYHDKDHHCRHEHPKHHGKHNHGKHKGHHK